MKRDTRQFISESFHTTASSSFTSSSSKTENISDALSSVLESLVNIIKHINITDDCMLFDTLITYLRGLPFSTSTNSCNINPYL